MADIAVEAKVHELRVGFMPLPNSLDAVLYGQLAITMDQEQGLCIERRIRPRLPVHWTVYLSRKLNAHRLESKTENLSSDGFYCYVSEPIMPGELVSGTIVIPNLSNQDRQICLQVNAQVVRLENSASGYGIGCSIEDYSILSFPHDSHLEACLANR